MSDLFRKLNLKDHSSILVLDAPPSFAPRIQELDGVTVRDAVGPAPVAFAIAFVTTLAGVERAAREVAPLLEGDGILWCAYPKGSSKRYTCEFNRDSGWEALGAAGFEPVRQVAIDEDWSALRFRRAEHIGTLRRDPARALSATGQARASATRNRRT
jgi:hypothetical protein